MSEEEVRPQVVGRSKRRREWSRRRWRWLKDAKAAERVGKGKENCAKVVEGVT